MIRPIRKDDFNIDQKELFRLQNNRYDLIQNEIINSLDEFFKDRITSGYTVLEETDIPYTMFSMQFQMYNYFNVIFNYDRGAFGCAIVTGDMGIGLDSSQKWYDKADMNVFLQEIQQQLELRITDKFLEYNSWKSSHKLQAYCCIFIGLMFDRIRQ